MQLRKHRTQQASMLPILMPFNHNQWDPFQQFATAYQLTFHVFCQALITTYNEHPTGFHNPLVYPLQFGPYPSRQHAKLTLVFLLSMYQTLRCEYSLAASNLIYMNNNSCYQHHHYSDSSGLHH